MKKILTIYPTGGGRFEGGITVLMNFLIDNYYDFNQSLKITHLNSNQINRINTGKDKLLLINFLNAFKLLIALKKEVKTNNYDFIYYHSSSNFALLKDLFILNFFSIKKILHIHFSEFEKVMPSNKILRRLILYLINKTCDGLILMNNSFKTELMNSYNFSKPIIKPIYNFIPFFNLKKPIVKTKICHKNKDCLNFLFVGSLESRKGLKQIILSYKNFINNSNSCSKLNIVGEFQDPNYKIEVMDLVVNNIKSENIIFLGKLNRNQITNIYKDSDVLIMNSVSEGLPVVLLESLYHGLAIITTPVGAIPEILSNSINSLYTDNSDDLIGLENNLHTLNNDRLILARLKNNNKKLSEKFTLKNFLYDFNNLLDEI
mgnify:CR=1 FL=1|jgi:glycosyltransferase involved in cell wall biosynthesis